MSETPDLTSVEGPPIIESLILANHVEAVNGLLYVAGGGWTDHHRVVAPSGEPSLSNLGVGTIVLIPWNQTSREHRLSVDIEDYDGKQLLSHTEAVFAVGRPPLLPPGGEQHVVLGLSITLVFPKAGSYRVLARLNGGLDTRRWSFRVHDISAPPGAQPPRVQR